MGIFSSIASAIFGSKAAAETTTAAAPSAAPATYSMASETSTPAAAPASAAASAPTASSAPQPVTRAQVEAIIAKIEADRGVKYNWRQSIVDLMKLLDLDSSLGARKELAQELGYKGALDGSAEMNVWLHKQVMEKLAEGGGKVPASLKS